MILNLSKILIISSGIACLSFAAEALSSRDLYDDLMRDYKPHIRPKIKFNDSLEVSVEFELIRIIQLEERMQLLTSAGLFVTRWDDDYLIWDPSKYGGIDDIVLPPYKIWLPDVGIENSADTFYHDSFKRDFHVRVHHTGRVQWSFGGEFVTLCALDMTMFPFDTQKCSVNIENWAYTGSEVALVNGTNRIELGNYKENGIWKINDNKVKKDDHYYAVSGPTPFPEIEFEIFLGRKSKYYILNLVLPCFFIIFVALGVYWVPPMSGEKVSLGITVLLALSVFQLVLQEQTPANSDFTPILGSLVFWVMGLSSLSVITAIVVLYLQFRDVKHPVPYCVKVVFFKGVACLLGMCKSTPDMMSDKVRPKAAREMTINDIENKFDEKQHHTIEKLRNMQEWSYLEDIASDIHYITDRMKAKDEHDAMMAEWGTLAKIIDRLMFWITTIILIVNTALFLQYYGNL